MYIVYTMLIYHVLIKVFSFKSGVMLIENVCVIRLNIRARLVSLLGPTSQKQRVGWLVGWFVVLELNGHLRQYFTLYQAVFQRGRKKKEMKEGREKCPNNRPTAPTACAVGPCPALICL